jgi:hypothetical protein
VEIRTLEHLQRATRNREIAQHLFRVSGLTPPPYEWVVVVAFYSAVHFANAYLWERQQYEPGDHRERLRAFSVVSALRPVYPDYARLQSIAFESCYLPDFSISEADALNYVDNALARVAHMILSELQ